jgi:hypothetical protein
LPNGGFSTLGSCTSLWRLLTPLRCCCVHTAGLFILLPVGLCLMLHHFAFEVLSHVAGQQLCTAAVALCLACLQMMMLWCLPNCATRRYCYRPGHLGLEDCACAGCEADSHYTSTWLHHGDHHCPGDSIRVILGDSIVNNTDPCWINHCKFDDDGFCWLPTCCSCWAGCAGYTAGMHGMPWSRLDL